MKNSSTIRLAVCILHYGSPLLTAKLHAQFLKAEPKRSADIRVLDNAAPEGYPNPWKRLDNNLYWPGAFAYALETLGNEGYTHLWFCNNDAELVSPAPYIERVEARLAWQEKKFGPVGELSPSLTHNPYHPHMVHQEGCNCVEAPYIDGVAPVVHIASVKELGGLDYVGNPYGYGVDIWLSLQLTRQGLRVLVDHAVTMRHKYHTTAGAVDGFISQAAQYEEEYMTKRLGQDWRAALRTLRENFAKNKQ